MSYDAKQIQLSEVHQPGTGNWLLQNETFVAWKTSSKISNLWCSEIPGAGKTVMASLVINVLQQEKKNVVFIYAEYKAQYQHTTLGYLSCITRQLASQNTAILELATSLYQTQNANSSLEQTPPLTFAGHMKLLHECSSLVGHVFIILDAVDEIPGIDERHGSDTRFELLQALAKLDYASVFCTCRPHISGTLHLEAFAEINVEATDADLRTFLEAKISASRRLSSFVSRDRALKEEIVKTITRKASGMFLLARLQLDQIVTAITIRQVRQMLDRLSSRLSDMYHHTLQRIREQSDAEAALGIRAISWIAHIERPLTVSEFGQALSIEDGDQSIDDSGIVDIAIILEACAGLLYLQPASAEAGPNGPCRDEETVHFVHYTMQEYWAENHTDLLASSHSDIANTCLTYLCLDNFRKGTTRRYYESNHTNSSSKSEPFLAYAAAFWPAHASHVEETLRYDLVKILVSPRLPWLSRTWLQFALRSFFGGTYTNIGRMGPRHAQLYSFR
jgi:hypothetical protein